MSGDPADPVTPVAPVPPLAPSERYHAFIAHSSEDRALSLSLKAELEARGFRCCHADTEFQLGQSVVSNITENIGLSRRVLLLVSPHFLRSHWTQFEAVITTQKQVASGKRVMVSILVDVDHLTAIPPYIKNTTYLTYGEEAFWSRLVHSLTDEVTLAEFIPAGNVAHGLAWSYFYGFLNLVLPGLFERIVRWTADHELDGRVVMKMVIILPRSCYCPGSLSELDDRLTFHDHLPFKATRAGNIDRDYKSSIYRVTDGDEAYYAVMELATPLLSLYEMERGAIAGLNTEDKLLQMNAFSFQLREILEHANNRLCNGKTTLLTYEDLESNRLAGGLAQTIVGRVRTELNRQA